MSAHDETLTPATLAGLGAASPAAAPTQRARFEADDVAAERHRSRERRRRLLRMARRGLLGFALVLAGVGVVWALRPKPVPVDATLAVRGQLVVAIEESGQTRVKDRYVVSAPVTGSLGRVRLEAGDEVRAGEPLAEIAPTVSPLLDERTRAESEARLGAALSALGQARTQTARAAAAKELAERDLQRARGLGQSGSITRQAVDQAEFEARVRTEDLASAEFAVKVAAEQVRVARMTLSRDGATGRGRHVDVLAPVTGRVLRVQQESAGVVAAGSPLVEIGDPRNLEVIVDLLTSDAVQVKPGTAVEIKGWGGAKPLAGQVRRVEPSAFTKPSALGVDEQRVNVVVAFADPPGAWAALGDGFRVEARLVLWQGENVVKVPLGAVFRQGDGWAVYRIEDEVARLTRIEIGHRGEAEVEITKGLAPNTLVAVHPGDRIKEGVRVDVRD